MFRVSTKAGESQGKHQVESGRESVLWGMIE